MRVASDLPPRVKVYVLWTEPKKPEFHAKTRVNVSSTAQPHVGLTLQMRLRPPIKYQIGTICNFMISGCVNCWLPHTTFDYIYVEFRDFVLRCELGKSDRRNNI